jgi:hypothetical protein
MTGAMRRQTMARSENTWKENRTMHRLNETARTILLAAAAGMALPILVAAEEPNEQQLSVADFEKLHRELQPPRDELWRSIPWHVSILEAREQAARNKKPIFVWVASGEPLGCG